ncbi:MAG: PTS transporter subunit EIIC, partial [Phascolarctobacterium sp.]|nr:PTS transporter subunit EIIC [Phascolarctobacterium sp.]
MNKEELARLIYELIGPKSNIKDLTNCMTRVRVQLHKEPSDESLKAIKGVMGVNHSGEELQIIIGPGKAAAIKKLIQGMMDAEPEIEEKTEMSTETQSKIEEKVEVSSEVQPIKENEAPLKEPHVTKEKPIEAKKSVQDLAKAAKVGDGKELHKAIKEKNATPAKLFLKKIANIFMPIIPAFIGCGLITGIINIIIKIDPSLASLPFVKILMLAGSAVFFGLNLFVGVNASKEFGGTPIIGGVLAAVLTQPALNGIEFMGMSFIAGRGGVIAVILIAAFAAYLENLLHRIVPDILDLFVTPLLTIIISTFAALMICQPLGGFLAESIGQVATKAIAGGGAITGFVLGGTFLPMVMVGIHQGLTPIHAQLLASFGVNILLPILAMAGAGQVGASCAVYFKTQNQALKKTV